MKYALINTDNLVVNCVEWDGVTTYDPGDATMILADDLYVGPGFTWDGIKFIPPQPYPSWVLNDATTTWDAPVPYPTDGGSYQWDEATVSWQVVVA